MPPGVPAPAPAHFLTEDLLLDLLAVSLTGVNILSPVYEVSGELVDFAIDYLSPAGQRMTGLAERPGGTLLSRFPHAIAAGIFGYYRRVFEAGATDVHEVNYQADSLDNYFRLAARRSGARLVVSFTDTSDQPLSPVEAALRDSQAAEHAARAEADAERQRLHQVLMRIPANIALLRGPEHIYDLVNPEYEQLFPARSPLGRTIREVIPELEGQGFYELFDRVYETGEPFYQAEAEAWADFAGTGEPQRRYYRTSFEPIRNAQGAVTEVLNFAVDVTAQVEARQQVEQLNAELETRVQARTQQALALQAELLAAAERQVQQHEAFYQVFEQTPAAVSLLRGPHHRFEYTNPAFRQVFAGRPLIGLDFAQALPDAEQQGYLALLDRVYQTGETFFGSEIPFVSAAPEGPPRTIYFNFTYQAYRENGEVVGISSFAFDATEQVLARRRAEDAAAELRLLTAHAPAFLFRLDPAAEVTYLNDAFFEWTGLTRTQPLGHDVLGQAVHPEDRPGLEASFVAAAAGQQPWESPLYRLRRHDGQYRWAFSRTQPVLEAATGQLSGHHGVTLEIHDQVEMQRQLQRTNADLDNFIYTASHDLKAPIANIEGLLLALEQELPPAGRVGDVPLMLELMQGAVERFTRTIAHLTDVSRLQKEHSQPSHQVLLASIIEEVQLDLAPLLAESQGRIDVAVADCPAVTFSEKNLRSVVYNLLSNALKYRHPDRVPEVSIRCRLAQSYQVLEVQDNGLGLDLVQGQDRLFAMFQRLHTHVEGTGIGLYMVKKIVENAGGRIEVTSQLGQGSTFAVYFPH